MLASARKMFRRIHKKLLTGSFLEWGKNAEEGRNSPFYILWYGLISFPPQPPFLLFDIVNYVKHTDKVLRII